MPMHSNYGCDGRAVEKAAAVVALPEMAVTVLDFSTYFRLQTERLPMYSMLLIDCSEYAAFEVK